jgi:sec-independent protein translocase protein TatB
LFDIGFDKVVLIAIIVGAVIGPKRLPVAAATLARYLRRLRTFIDDTKAAVETELGTEPGEFDWQRLDPRQYDPRRIIRDAFYDDVETESTTTPLEDEPPNDDSHVPPGSPNRPSRDSAD